MPLVLSKNPALLPLQPLAEEVDANKPPVINTYTPEVEKWRRQVWDSMPPALKQRSDSATLLDKALYVMEGESGGSDTVPGDGGAAYGLYQSHHIPTGSDAQTQINDMWRMVSNNPDQWTDWGEGTLYEGKPFGALGAKPYNGSNPSLWGKATNAIGNTPQISRTNAVNTYTDALNQATNPLARSALSQSLQTAQTQPDPVTGLDPTTGGITGSNYGPFDTRQGSDYVDAPTGSMRAKLEAQRRGEDQLGQAALAGAVALPMIGAGPVATALGAVGSEVGAEGDKRLGLPKINIPVLGETGPLGFAGGLLGGTKAENALSPQTAPGRPWANVVKPRPNLRVIQPGETPPGALGITGKGKPDPVDFISKARAMGMTDDEIRTSFPGALEAASGIDTTPQVTARIDQEQAAKGAAAKRIWNRAFDETHDVDFANSEARKAASQAPEALPTQRPNQPFDPDAAEQMRQASQRVRGQGITGETGEVAPMDPDAILARGAQILGDPATELRLQAQKLVKGQVKGRLQQIIEDYEEDKGKGGKRRTPEENAALKTARTAGPENQPKTLQDLLDEDTSRFEPPVDNPNAQQLALGGQGGQIGLGDAPEPYAGAKPPEGLTLQQQRLNRGLNEPAGFPGEGEVIEAAKGLKPDQQASLLNKNWKPGTSIASTTGRVIGDVFTVLPRALQTAFDYSYPFRQGVLEIRHQKDFWPAFQKGFRSLFDEDFARQVQRNVEQAPYNPKTLELTSFEKGASFLEREEDFISRLTDKLPGIKQSSRAATVFINSLRSGVANRTARSWIRQGADLYDPQFQQDLDALGNYLNRATGRGNLGDFERSVGLLNQVFYGARRNVAMVQAPGYLFHSSAKVRKEAWLDFLGLFGTGMAVLQVADLAGADVSLNPGDADFGKIKIGDTRVDIWGGYQQTANFVYRVIDGQIKDAGDIDSAWKAFLPYLGNKLSPQASIAVSTLPEGVRKPIQPVDRPFSIDKSLTPLAWQGLIDAIKEDNAVGAAIGLTGFFGTGVQSYESQTDVRNKAAQELGFSDYESLTPAQRAQVDKTPAVQKYQQENPSGYKQSKDRLLAPINQAEQQAEQAFKENKLSKPLPDIWHEQGIQRQQVAKGLADQFKDMFEGFDKTRYDRATEGYFNTQKFAEDGQLDFDATESARQDYLKTLKPDERQWLDEALQVSRENKSPAHQKYLKYIDERKAAGYFDVKADDPDRAKKLVQLDQKNPLQDALNWYWKGGTVDTNRIPALNSPDAVAYALQLAPTRPVTYAGLGRPLNQTPQTLQAYEDYKGRIQNYYTKTVPAYQESESQELFGKAYKDLDRKQQQSVTTGILTKVRRGSPELEAILQYLGDTADANGDYIVSAEAGPYLRNMIAKYGSQPVKSVNASGRPSKFLVRE